MPDKLTSFITGTAGEPWRLRFSDCAPWACRWIEVAIGVEVPLPEYSTQREAVAVLRNHGGLKSLATMIGKQIGLEETLAPRRGDVGLIQNKLVMGGVILAICLGSGKWAARVALTSQNATISGPVLKAWSVPWPV